jgi:Tol biopolymer transport system component
MNADGTGKTFLTNSYPDRLVWSPDGKKIAFTSFTPEGKKQISVINVDGTNLTNLTSSGTNFWMDWSPK